MLFNALSGDLFLVFSREHRALYAHMIVSIYNNHYGMGALSSQRDADVINHIARELERNPDLWRDNDEPLEDLPDAPPAAGRRKGRRRVTATNEVSKRAHHIYARLLKCGWFEETTVGFQTFADMPPSVIALTERLAVIEQGLAQHFGGVVSTVHTTLKGIRDEPAKHGASLIHAAESARGFSGKLWIIRSDLKRIEKTILSSDDRERRLERLFDEFVGEIMIQDYRALFSQNHPYRHRFAILATAEEIKTDPDICEDIASAYLDSQAAKDHESAVVRLHADLDTIIAVFGQVEQALEEIRSFQYRLEGRLVTIVRYVDRGDKSRTGHLAGILNKIVETSAVMREALDEDIDFAAPILNDETYVSPETLAPARRKRNPVEAKPVVDHQIDKAVLARKKLLTAFLQRFDVSEREMDNYLQDQLGAMGEADCRTFQVETLDDFIRFDAVRLAARAGWGQLPGGYEFAPKTDEEDQRADEWMVCDAFKIRRKAGFEKDRYGYDG